MAEKLYDVWARRNPNWEKRYEESIIKNFSDYGKGVTNLGDAKGKLFGAGYEIFIIAFFIGLYYDQRRNSLMTVQKSNLWDSRFNIGVI